MKKLITASLGTFLAATIASSAIAADSVADFYRGKQIKFMIGSGVGGGYDTFGRTVARFLGKHIPGNPTVLVQNMPGAGSMKMVNHVANQGPRDGTMMAAPQNGVGFEPVFHLLSPGGKNAKYDATKFNWVGSANQGTYLSMFWHDKGIKTFDDLKKREVTVAASGMNTDEAVIAQVLNNILGTKLKVIAGYKAGAQTSLAMEKGEVEGVAAIGYASLMVKQPTWLKEGKIVVPLQMGLDPHPKLKGVPFVLDLVENDADRRILEVIFTKYKMARPYFLPQGVPADRVAAIRKAFIETTKDPEFLAEAKKRRLEINPVAGEDVQKIVQRIYDTPKELLTRVRGVIGGK